MSKYDKLKNDELKKLLTERGLATTGKKADLIARLTDLDKPSAPAKSQSTEPSVSKETGKSTAGTTETTAPTRQTQTPASTVQTAKPDVSPTLATTTTTTTQSNNDDDREAKLAARAARFGIPSNEEAEKKKARAARFGSAATSESTTQGTVPLPEDTVLSQPKPKRQQEKTRPTPSVSSGGKRAEKRKSSILDDPIEAEKARKRALKFGTAGVAIPHADGPKDLPPVSEVASH